MFAYLIVLLREKQYAVNKYYNNYNIYYNVIIFKVTNRMCQYFIMEQSNLWHHLKKVIASFKTKCNLCKQKIGYAN